MCKEDARDLESFCSSVVENFRGTEEIFVLSDGYMRFNKKWLADVEARHYKNQKYLVEDLPNGKKKLYGLESEAIATARLSEKLKEVMVPVIGGNEEALKIYEMKNLNQAIKDLIIFKLTHPETEAAHAR